MNMMMRMFSLFVFAATTLAAAESIQLTGKPLAGLQHSQDFKLMYGQVNPANYLGAIYDSLGNRPSAVTGTAGLVAPFYIDYDATPNAKLAAAILAADNKQLAGTIRVKTNPVPVKTALVSEPSHDQVASQPSSLTVTDATPIFMVVGQKLVAKGWQSAETASKDLLATTATNPNEQTFVAKSLGWAIVRFIDRDGINRPKLVVVLAPQSAKGLWFSSVNATVVGVFLLGGVILFLLHQNVVLRLNLQHVLAINQRDVEFQSQLSRLTDAVGVSRQADILKGRPRVPLELVRAKPAS